MSSSLNILVPIDIEDEVRQALAPYFDNVVAGDLPPTFSTPILRVRQTGGGTANTIDKFNVTIDARGTTDIEAYDLIRKAQGVLEAQCKEQFGELRYVEWNTLAQWGSDPVRPDLKLCTLTATITAHRESLTIEFK